jgi:hypothetical protein
VIVRKGDKALGPGDVFEVDGGPQPAWQVVQHWLEWTKPEGSDRRLAEAFIRLGQVTGGNGKARSWKLQ